MDTAAPPEPPPWAEPDEVLETCASFEFTELGLGKRFQTRHGRDVRYDENFRQWLVWDGRVFRADPDGLRVQARMQHTAEALADELRFHGEGKPSRGKLQSFRRDAQRYRHVQAALAHAKSLKGVAVNSTMLDAQHHLFNTENGTIDLERKVIWTHRRADLLTIYAPDAYDPEATAPTWMRCLEEWHPVDPETQTFLQKLAG